MSKTLKTLLNNFKRNKEKKSVISLA